ncbi:hypothetical protein GJ699_22630 [Duganella sp. FT80W]|uniref:Uncharacterized protein n=2 Tax=Duganella guangzhouensis TaxID=2666084 RepID=A0A6I2L954_9BURK|nr:hypothetical protein [Duganella guangzhouensis]MRW92799.1 hypothetical protein [Duganella guangzhouensis]
MSYKKFKLLKGLWILVIAAALGGIVMQLWNCLIPDIIPGVHAVTYWQALGLLLLCRILFGGFRGHRDWHERREHWQRWQAMTPEERGAFFKNRANFCRPAPPETKE